MDERLQRLRKARRGLTALARRSGLVVADGGAGAGAAPTARDLNADFFASERIARGLRLEVIARANVVCYLLAGATASFLCARFVDFVGALGAIGKDQDLIPCDLEKTTANRHGLFRAALLDPHHARIERGQQRRMLRQNADETFRTGRHDHIDGVIREHFSFGGHDLYTQWHVLARGYQDLWEYPPTRCGLNAA